MDKQKQIEELIDKGMTQEIAVERINAMCDEVEKADNLAAAYYRLFSSSEGRDVLRHLESEYHNVPSFDENPYAMARNEGCRAVYLAIKYNIAKGEEILQMRRINHE